MDYEGLKHLPWQEAVKKEGYCSIVREIGEGWWLFEKNTHGDRYYNGILGWDPQRQNQFWAVHNPADVVEYQIARLGLNQDKKENFTDGRQIKWITKNFLPPVHSPYTKTAMLQIGAISEEDMEHLDRIHAKLEDLLISGSKQHKSAMKIAKDYRETFKKKWSGYKQRKTLPEQIPYPENVAATLNLLNGNNKQWPG